MVHQLRSRAQSLFAALVFAELVKHSLGEILFGQRRGTWDEVAAYIDQPN